MARTDPLLQRALLESQLKLGPQGTVLRQLLSELAGSYTRTRRVNASNEVGIKAATQEARPDVSRAFDTALSSVSAQRAALGRSDDPQASAYQRRVGEQRANALNDLTQREVRATEGRVYANQTARDEYLGGKAKIQGQLLDLAGQHGALTASTLAELRDEQRKARQENRRIGISEAAQRETARHNRVQETTAQARARQQRQGAGKIKWATPQQHSAARSQIEQARALIDAQVKRGTTSRAAIIRLLTTGRPKRTVEVDGKKVDVPAIPKLPADFVRAASNLYFDSSLSRQDLKRLHNAGLQLRRLGYEVRPPQGPRPRGAAGLAVSGRGGRVGRRPPVPGLSR